jgi:sulfite dehydrogenase (quinone) subunit SoeC
MNPAYSVILFTTASGAGYGLLALTAMAGAGHGKASTVAFALTALFIALALITTGLLSSTMHLGRPERVWRAFSQWRTSWLSREGVVAILTYPAAIAFGLCWSGLIDAPGLIAPLGYATAILCTVTVFCTAQIYATLKTIPAWHSKLTVPTYLAFALATGSAWLMAISVYFGRFQAGAGNFQAFFTLISVFAVIVLKFLYWRKLRKARGQYTMAAATGLGEGVRQWEVPHTSTNFIMKEMGYQVARRQARKLQQLCMLLLDVCFVLAFLTPTFPWVAYLIVPLIMLAAWMERWLFFAQAEHVVGLFYGKERV